MSAATQELRTGCVIAGGGPAGMMLGFLLARAGVRVMVLEKHADFLRDFRGDTVHPSTLRVMRALGLLEAFLALPHHKFREMRLDLGDRSVPVADFGALGAETGFVAMMPQWDFLDFLADQGRALPEFDLRMQTKATELVAEGGRVTGLLAEGPEGKLRILADLVVGADGRHSALRAEAGLQVRDLGAPIDVLWFRVTRAPGQTDESLGRIAGGRVLVLLNRGDYWQMACVVPKGGFDVLRAAGIAAFRDEIAALARLTPAQAAEIDDWDRVKLLSVRVDRLERWWREGLLFIGDAAHAMSPVGGVGINLAIQDAVAAANLLAGPLRAGPVPGAALAAVQKRRLMPVRVVQRMQVLVQERMIAPQLGRRAAALPLPLRLLIRFPLLRRVPAWFIGLGPRPELPDDRASPGPSPD
ncbi:MAG: FAD-dependent oxidoreductase [Bacteroidetes bacterium]|nr:FAD-dependent oxidoreductase [Bacteroidota bacterium]